MLKLLIMALLLPAAVAVAQQQENVWEVRYLEECGFSVELPGEPTIQTETRQSRRITIQSYTYEVRDGMTTYAIKCTYNPQIEDMESDEEVFEMLMQNARSRQGVTGIEETSVHGQRGVKYSYRMHSEVIVHFLMFVKNDVLIQVDTGMMGDGAVNQSSRIVDSMEFR